MIYDFIKKCNFDSNSIIVEIGTHMGFDTELLFSNSNNAQIHCFEPDPRNIQILKKRNIDKIAFITEAAVSDVNSHDYDFYLSSGKIPKKTGNSYFDDNDWSASSSIRQAKIHNEIFPWCKFEEKIKITSITLDSYCNNNNIKKINFIWMDVQGCEDLVINGGKEILKYTQFIYTEFSEKELYAGQKNLYELLNLLPGKWEIKLYQGENVLLENTDYKNKFILNNGAWDTKNLNEHVFDLPLSDEIIKLLKILNINECLDLGCGNGEYVKRFNENNINCVGYDGNPNTPELTNFTCKILDLSKEINLKKYQCVLSIEVGEHIPLEYENIYIQNILNHSCNLIILSWAIPEQKGYGHINCKSNEQIISIIESNGFISLPDKADDLRKAAHNGWFKETLMVFKRKNND